MRRYVLLGLGLAIAAPVLVLYLKGHSQGGLQATLTDLNRTRNLGFFLTHRKESLPVAADGRIDVYDVFLTSLFARTQEDIDDLYRSARLDFGPTLAEVRAGDYTNFPYQRFKGVPSRGDPWLWDRRPVRGHRVIAFWASASVLVDEQEARAILARAGQE